MSRTKREERRSTARRRAEQHASGFETTTLKMPEGLGFWNPGEGVHNIDIIPYTVKIPTKFAKAGDLHFEKTYFAYRNIGLEDKSYIAPGKTFGKPDPIAEYRAEAAKDGTADPEELKKLAPKERQLFLIYDRADEAKGIQLWDFSYHNFGKLLDTRIDSSDPEDGWDFFYYPDEDGLTLRLTISKASGGGYNFKEVTAIDFKPRKTPLPKEIVDHKYCLDDMLLETPYEVLKKIFEGQPVVDGPDADEPDDDQDEPEKENVEEKEEEQPEKKERKKRERKKKEEPVEEDVFKVGAKVIFIDGDDEEECTIVRVSKDGTSFTLEDANEAVIKAVSKEEMRPIVDAAPSKKERDKQADEVFGGGEEEEKKSDDWDSDWD